MEKKLGRPVKENKPEMMAFTIRIPKEYESKFNLKRGAKGKTTYASDLLILDLNK